MRITRSEYEKALAKHYGVVGATRTADLPADTLASSTGTPSFVVNPRPFAPQVEAVLRELGIEIVPDPEPEITLPPRPWSIFDGQMTRPGLAVLDDKGASLFWTDARVHLGIFRQLPFQRAVLEALVSAYNAAGERKRITLKKDRYDHWYIEDVGDDYTYARPDYAIGAYVKEHASDLGLEIVES